MGDNEQLVSANKYQTPKKPIDNEYDKKFNWDQEDPWLGVDVESGYVKMSKPEPKAGAPNNEAFYFMYKSKNIENPRVLVCQIGGPGCAIMCKSIGSNNPIRLNQEKRCLELNPDSICDDYHIIYIECPVGVGFSIGYKENCVKDYQTLGDNAAETLKEIIRKNPYLQNADFYWNGESFCGLSVPIVVDSCRKQLKINFKGAVLECHVMNLVEQQCGCNWQLAALDEYKLWNNGYHKCCCHCMLGYSACCYSMGCIGFGTIEGLYYLPWLCPCGGWQYDKKEKCKFGDEVKPQQYAKVGLTNLTKRGGNGQDTLNMEDVGGNHGNELLVCTNKFAEMLGAKKSITGYNADAVIDIIDNDLKYTSNEIQAGWVREGISLMIISGEGDYIVPWQGQYEQLEKHWNFETKAEFLKQQWKQVEGKPEDPTFYHHKKVQNFEWRRVAGCGHLVWDDFPKYHGEYIRDFMNQHY